MHLDNHGNSWVTLTYRDPAACTKQQYKDGQFIPSDLSLRPSDVTKFIRALRRSTDVKKRNPETGRFKTYRTKTIRYFYCGEYGDLGRPHYHICLFNHTFNDLQLFKDEEGLYTYTSPTLEKLWPHGFSTTAELNYNTAAYTAGYIFDKITGKKAQDHYLRCDENGEAYWLKPEFIRMSTGNKKPPCGLGAGFYEKFQDDIFPADETPVPGKGVMQYVPRYYQNILQKNDPAQLELIQALRKKFFEAHREEFTPERLRDKYICAKASYNLKRTLP